MRKKHRVKAALYQKKQKEKREDKKRKREALEHSQEDVSFASVFGTCIVLLIMLLIGWYCLINHLDEDI